MFGVCVGRQLFFFFTFPAGRKILFRGLTCSAHVLFKRNAVESMCRRKKVEALRIRGSVKDTDMDIVMWHRLLYPYEQAVDELMLKFNYMKKEYQVFGRYCPIEHVIGRVKSITSILDKLQRKNVPLERVEQEIEDIAGIRIICQFVEDISRIADVISRRSDIEVVEIKDYIRNKKQSGYRSFHMVVKYVVNSLDGPRTVNVEIQIRTMAMDFWATIEHSLQYKYKGEIPEHADVRLSNAANAVSALDKVMSSVREDVMDAQLSSQIRNQMVKDIAVTIERLYRITPKREVEKIQDEFYQIYQTGNLDLLTRFYEQIQLIAETYKAQVNERGEGLKKTDD